jgi:plastocyanin
MGTTVTWTNDDGVNHTVTSDQGAFDSGPLATGQTFSQTFNQAGTFTYHCTIHPSMQGTVVVQ